MTVVRINEFQSAENKADELHDFLKSLVPYITSSEGCLSCEVLQSVDEPSVFAVIEKWDSVAQHKKSLEGFPVEEMQAAMSLFGAPPKGIYYKA